MQQTYQETLKNLDEKKILGELSPNQPFSHSHIRNYRDNAMHWFYVWDENSLGPIQYDFFAVLKVLQVVLLLKF